MTHKGSQKPPYYKIYDCKQLEKLHKEPSFNDKLNEQLSKDKVTTSAAKISPSCTGMGNPIIGTSCSGYIRRFFKPLINQADCSVVVNGNIIIKTLESLGSIVLSPSQSELKADKVKFCEQHNKEMNCRQCHAEVSILSSLAKKGFLKKGANILFNINWTADQERIKMPCVQCHRLMKEISEKCEVNIEICGKNGYPVPITLSDSTEELAKKVMRPSRLK